MDKNLRVSVNTDLKFSKHVEVQLNKANRMLGFTHPILHIPRIGIPELFVAFVRPHLEYVLDLIAKHMHPNFDHFLDSTTTSIHLIEMVEFRWYSLYRCGRI